MNTKEILNFADKVLYAYTGRYLTDVQRLILRESLFSKSYEEIRGYGTQDLRTEDLRLWRLLSEALHEEVSETTCRDVLERNAFERELEFREDESVLQLIDRAARERWTELDLSEMGLTELPPEIGKLTHLTKLVLNHHGSQKNLKKQSSSKYNKIQCLPSEIGNLTNLQSLFVYGNELTTLPETFERLSSLIELDLSANNLLTFPTAIRQLVNLKRLDLSNNQLAEIPDFLKHALMLEELNLNRNKLTELPESVVKLRNLKCLSLDNNQLTTLPESVAQLVKLEILNLRFNQLINLTESISSLTRLNSISLSNNQLSSLPNSIGNLINLTDLYLGNNQLKDLPKSFSSLSKLVKLRVSSNHLEVIPEVITQLVNLRELDLSLNQISSLPGSMAQLTNLKELSISFNELDNLPEEIEKLTNLKELSLANNQLKNLPETISKLTSLRQLILKENQIIKLPKSLILLNLTELNLDGNLLPPIPPEISIKGIKAIVSYYLQLQQEQKRALNEAKLLIVGQGSVGKTSLMKRIIGQSFDPDEHKTEGINIQSWSISTCDKSIQLNVWDFGGQEIMHATHQFFLTKRSLYLLVLDSRIGEEENRIEYWLKLIQSFGEGSPVIVVGNKRDEHPLDIDRRGLQTKYSNIRAFIETSCLDGQGIAELQAKIRDLISQALTKSGDEEDTLKHIRDMLPLSWFNVKTKLGDMSQDFISYEAYEQICQAEGITEDLNQNTLIQLLHDLGIVLNFRDDPRLEDTNILNPEWVTSGVYRILNDNFLMTEFKGILERNQLNRILKTKRYPRRKHLFLINIMRKFELCFDMDGFADEKFLVPDLLPKEEPYTGKWQNALAFEYHYPILPGSILSRFIVRMNDKIHQRTYWRNGVILAYENSIALVKADREDKRIVIRIQNAGSAESDRRRFLAAIRNKIQGAGSNGGDRRRFLAIIRSQFDAIHKTIPGLDVEQKVPLPDHPNILLDYQNLLDYEEMDESFIIPSGLKERVNVKALLDGLESEPDRQRRKEDTIDLKDKPTPHYTFVERSSMSTINQFGLGDNFGGDQVMGDKIDTQINNSQDLAQAAKDIKTLLEQLSEEYPSDSSRVLGAKAADQIERNPELRSRILRGVKAGGFAALEKMIDHPVAKFFIEGAKEVLKP